MKCPACDVTLDRDSYEDYPVFHCPKCSGYLLQKELVGSIKSTRDRSSRELEQEADVQQSPDTEGQIRCPKCLARLMSKEKIPMTERDDEPFFIDVCRTCQMVWFNGGELAKLQLDYENSAKAIEELDFRLRAQQRTPEEQEQFEANVAALPQSGFWLAASAKRVIAGVVLLVLGISILAFPVYTASSFDLSFFLSLRFLVSMISALILTLASLWILTRGSMR